MRELLPPVWFPMRVVAACAVLLSLLLGCNEDQKVFEGAQSGPTTDSDPPVTPGNTTFPSFVSDHPPGPDYAIRLNGQGTSEDSIHLSLMWDRAAAPSFDPNSVDLLLKFSPEAEAEFIGKGASSWCSGAPVEVSPTGTPGEWRIRRLASTNPIRCWCPDFTRAHSPHLVTSMTFKVKPGAWDVQLLAGEAKFACNCGDVCDPAPALHGGRIVDPPPNP